MWKTIYEKLKADGLNPYPPGKHKGLCNQSYSVVKESNQIPTFYTNKLGTKLIDVIVFVPLASYVDIEGYKNSIINSLKTIKSIKKTGNETPVIIDDDKQAYTLSLEYKIMKRLEG